MRAREDQLSEIEVAAALKAIKAAVEKRDEVALRATLERVSQRAEILENRLAHYRDPSPESVSDHGVTS